MDSDAIPLSPADLDAVTRTVVTEGGNPDAWGSVANVIRNRMAAGGFGDTGTAIVQAPKQFEVWSNGRAQAIDPNSDAYQRGARVVAAVFSGGVPDNSGGATHFYSPSGQQALAGDGRQQVPSWAKNQTASVGGNVFFAPNGTVSRGGGTTSASAAPDTNAPDVAGLMKLYGADAATAPAVADPAQESPSSSPPPAQSPAPAADAPDIAGLMKLYGAAPDQPATPPVGQQPAATPATGTSGSGAPATDPGPRPLTVHLAPQPTAAPPQPPVATPATPAATPDLSPSVGPYGALNRNAFASAPPPASPNALTGAPAADDLSRGLGVDGAGQGSAPAATAPASAPDTSAQPGVVNALLHTLAEAGSGALGGGLVNPLAARLASVINGQSVADNEATGNALTAQWEKDHPYASTAANVAGNLASYAGIGSTAAGAKALGLTGETLLGRALTGGATNALLSGGDAALRNGGDPTATETAAAVGGGAGLAGPYVGRAIGSGVNALQKYAGGILEPGATAAKNLLQSITDTGGDVNALGARMEANPRLTVADLNPGARTAAQGLLGGEDGPARNTIVAFNNDRMAGRTGAVQGAYDDLAAQPDVKATLDGIRSRADADEAFAPTAIRGALDDALGNAKDPRAALGAIIEQRAAEAQPLYQAALNKPVVWTNRLQQFLDDPVMQQGINKGIRIQRLESLADGTPFNPTDYAITDFDAAGDPIVSGVPNMKTLNVAKKGLDAMVQDSQDPVTGRLSQEGVAIDKVRAAFVKQLDVANPDYAAARAAWQGPTLAHQAFQRGLGLFGNASGMAGIDNTPGAIASFLKTASPAEADAIKAGARAAAEQTMMAASDPAQAGANLVSNEANRAKLASVLGPDEADALAQKLNHQYGDPIGDAFNKGADMFRNRTGSAGMEDRPEFLKAWLDTASPAEKEAQQAGAMASLQQQLGSVKNAALKGQTIPEIAFNRAKMDLTFGSDKSAKLVQQMADERAIAETNSKLFQTSQTQPLQRAARGVGSASARPHVNGDRASDLHGESGKRAHCRGPRGRCPCPTGRSDGRAGRRPVAERCDGEHADVGRAGWRQDHQRAHGSRVEGRGLSRAHPARREDGKRPDRRRPVRLRPVERWAEGRSLNHGAAARGAS